MSSGTRVNLMLELLTANDFGIQDLRKLGEYLTSEDFKKIIAKPEDIEEKRISEILSQMKAPIQNRVYLQMAVKLAVCSQKEDAIGVIYAKIANEYDFNSSVNIEKKIMQTIEGIWRKADKEVIAKYLGENIAMKERRPTNSVFIMALAQYLLEEKF